VCKAWHFHYFFPLCFLLSSIIISAT
jgi:hypothetical protein